MQVRSNVSTIKNVKFLERFRKERLHKRHGAATYFTAKLVRIILHLYWDKE